MTRRGEVEFGSSFVILRSNLLSLPPETPRSQQIFKAAKLFFRSVVNWHSESGRICLNEGSGLSDGQFEWHRRWFRGKKWRRRIHVGLSIAGSASYGSSVHGRWQRRVLSLYWVVFRWELGFHQVVAFIIVRDWIFGRWKLG